MPNALPLLAWIGLGFIGWVLFCMSFEDWARRTWARENLPRPPSRVYADQLSGLWLSLLVGPFAILVALMSDLDETPD